MKPHTPTRPPGRPRVNEAERKKSYSVVLHPSHYAALMLSFGSLTKALPSPELLDTLKP